MLSWRGLFLFTPPGLAALGAAVAGLVDQDALQAVRWAEEIDPARVDALDVLEHVGGGQGGTNLCFGQGDWYWRGHKGALGRTCFIAAMRASHGAAQGALTGAGRNLAMARADEGDRLLHALKMGQHNVWALG